MKMRVLGCHGGELPKHRTTCFLLDGKLALDAGALTSTLTLDELMQVDDIVLSHSHLDHVKDLPLLVDILVGRRAKPVVVHASSACAQTLKDSVFNDKLWPDFTKIPTSVNPVLEIRTFRLGKSFMAGQLEIMPILMKHPVESCGFVVQSKENDGTVLAMSGDTGPTQEFWDVLNSTTNLRALLLETSFPNELQCLADVSGHLTPRTAKNELQKFHFRRDCDIFLYHLKPAFIEEIKKQLNDAQINAHVLELNEIFEF